MDGVPVVESQKSFIGDLAKLVPETASPEKQFSVIAAVRDDGVIDKVACHNPSFVQRLISRRVWVANCRGRATFMQQRHGFMTFPGNGYVRLFGLIHRCDND